MCCRYTGRQNVNKSAVSEEIVMDNIELIDIEERIRRKNVEIASQLRALYTLNSIQKLAELLAEILSVRR